jgi:hypothetical protein
MTSPLDSTPDPLLTLEPHREEHLAESLAGLVRVLGVGGRSMAD